MWERGWREHDAAAIAALYAEGVAAEFEPLSAADAACSNWMHVDARLGLGRVWSRCLGKMLYSPQNRIGAPGPAGGMAHAARQVPGTVR